MTKSFRDTIYEWIGIAGIGCTFISVYNALPPSWQGQVLGAGGAAVISFMAPIYLSKWFRFSARIWTDRMIIQETDSGRLPHFEFFLRRERPSFLEHPIKHIFLPWRIVVGRVNMVTGSISITRKFVKHIVRTDYLRWECGTNEIIKGKAAKHIVKEEERILKCVTNLNQKDSDLLDTINALHTTGVKLKP